MVGGRKWWKVMGGGGKWYRLCGNADSHAPLMTLVIVSPTITMYPIMAADKGRR